LNHGQLKGDFRFKRCLFGFIWFVFRGFQIWYLGFRFSKKLYLLGDDGNIAPGYLLLGARGAFFSPGEFSENPGYPPPQAEAKPETSGKKKKIRRGF